MTEYPNWFASTPAQQNFATYLEPFKGKPYLNFLQLGVYTGDATVWLMDNILTDETSYLTDIDTWLGSNEEAHEKINFIEVFELYKDRIARHKNVIFHRKTTWDFLRFHPSDELYDFIYIDADHTSMGALLDAKLSWDLLKSGGILAFDDYEWDAGKGLEFNPKLGINAFVGRHYKELDVIHQGWQLWVSKK